MAALSLARSAAIFDTGAFFAAAFAMGPAVLAGTFTFGAAGLGEGADADAFLAAVFATGFAAFAEVALFAVAFAFGPAGAGASALAGSGVASDGDAAARAGAGAGSGTAAGTGSGVGAEAPFTAASASGFATSPGTVVDGEAAAMGAVFFAVAILKLLCLFEWNGLCPRPVLSSIILLRACDFGTLLCSVPRLNCTQGLGICSNG